MADMKKGVIIQLVDIEKFFDTEILRTVMTCLSEANVNKKAYRCWFKLNETTKIAVATPVGLTKTAEVKEIVAQGSGGAALASGADIARGLESQFASSLDEIIYGWIQLRPLAYQDDVSRLAPTVESTRAGSIKISAMMDQKGLKCHPTKTLCIAVGSEKYRSEVKKEVDKNPVMFGNFTVKFQESEVYLGDVISAQGLETSVELTISRRLGKVKGAMNEAKAIIEDFQMQAIGGMAGAWDLWERAILPSLLANCGSWIGIGNKIYKTLNEIQYTYLRMIYSCPPSTPLLALRTQAGMMDAEQRIWVEKVSLVAKILHSSQEEENLCREVLEVQLAMGWPGLIKEVQNICKTVGLEDVTKHYHRRDKILEYVQFYDMKIAKEKMLPLEKCKLIRDRDCRDVRPYMFKKSLQQSRMEFLWETAMIDTRTTMKSKYEKDKYECPHCEEGVLETPSHLLVSCAAYSDLREGSNPELVLEDRATFLTRAIGRRKELENKLSMKRAESQVQV